MSRKRTGVMLAYELDERRLSMMPEHVYVQPKLDGLRMRALPTTNGYKLYSSTGLSILSLPHIVQALNREVPYLERRELDGEAYCHSMSFQEICSIVKRQNVHSRHMEVLFTVFDMITPEIQRERMYFLDCLAQIVMVDGFIDILGTGMCRKEELPEYLSFYIGKGYEGIIVRNPDGYYELKRSSNLLKMKLKHKAEVIIAGYFEAISEEGLHKETLGGLILANGQKCGAGCLTHDERDFFWDRRDELCKRTAYIKYLTLTDNGLYREPILMEIK